MKRLVFLCLMPIYVLASLSVVAHSGSSRDMHVWRAEYEHALSVQGGELDDAACLTMAGDMAGALEALGESDDKFRRGLLAYKTGNYRESIDLFELGQSNSHLEFHRLYFKASAYFKLKHYTEAAEISVLLLDNPVCKTGNPLRSRALELLLEAALHHGVGTDT